MFITINGQLGSGKSEICKILKDEHGFDIFHTGKIQRQYAAELGISTLQLNELCKIDHKYCADLTLNALKLQLEIETIKPTNKKDILDAFCGYTTWQKLESVIPNLRFYSKSEIDEICKEKI